jgi:hypothetical protein
MADPGKEIDKEKVDVLKPMVSMAKMDIDEIRVFTGRLNDFLKDAGPMALRICECCVDVSIT